MDPINADIVAQTLTPIAADVAAWSLDVGPSTGLPQVSVKGWWADDGDALGGGDEGVTLGNHTAFDDGAGNTEDYVIPNINVSNWRGTSAAESGAVSGMPKVDMARIRTYLAPISGDDDGGGPGPSGDPNGRLEICVSEWDNKSSGISTSSGDEGLKLPNINVNAWADNATGITVSNDDIPRVDIQSIDQNISTAASNLRDLVNSGYDTVNQAIERVNLIREDGINATSIADDAIDESAIAIDSVTYEQISSSAVAEIVEGVWNADVLGPIDDSGVYDGTAYRGADPGSMGHAMIVQYISQNILSKIDLGGGDTYFSPVHSCSVGDPGGTKFYSKPLNDFGAIQNLNSHEIPAYIDKTAVLVRGISSSVAPALYEQYLVRISAVETDSSGQYFVISLTDEYASPIPGGIDAALDVLIIKAEADATMHEIADEVWEEEVEGHLTPKTFGMFSRIVTGLSQFNHRIKDSTYDESGRLVACRLVVYPDASAAEDDRDHLVSVQVTSSYDEKQNMETFLSKES